MESFNSGVIYTEEMTTIFNNFLNKLLFLKDLWDKNEIFFEIVSLIS